MKRLLRVLLLLVVSGYSFGALAQAFGQDDRSRVFDAVVDVFMRNYWDAQFLDWEGWAAPYREDALTAPSRQAFDRVITRMVGDLADQHSSWLGRAGYLEELPDRGSPQPRLGISGRLLRGSGVVVERVYSGSSAERAGMRRGDVIVSVDEHDLTGQFAPGLVWQWLGEASRQERVSLQLLRGRSQLRLMVTPAPFELSEAQALPQAEMLDERLGYLYLPSFNHGEVGSRVHELVAELQAAGMRELIVDIRGNPGGRLTELGLMLGVFVDGPWARAVSRGEVAWYAHYAREGSRGEVWLAQPDGSVLLRSSLENPVRFSGPLVVLVDGSNSSAGELAALVLQSQGRAKVVGERTGGNVEAVRGFDLPDGSVVMVAVANVEGANGVDFSRGVLPDAHARATLSDLARGYDAPLEEAKRLLRGLPFTPNRYFGGGSGSAGKGG